MSRCEYEYPEHSTLIALPSNHCGIWASYSSDCCGLLCLAHKDDEFCSVGAKHVLLEKLPKVATEGRNTSASADQKAENPPPSEASEDRPIQPSYCGDTLTEIDALVEGVLQQHKERV